MPGIGAKSSDRLKVVRYSHLLVLFVAATQIYRSSGGNKVSGILMPGGGVLICIPK